MLWTGWAAAQTVRVEIHAVPSVTMSETRISSAAQGRRASNARWAAAPAGRRRAAARVLLLHGSGGVGVNLLDWEQELNALGVATSCSDALSGRGIVQTSTTRRCSRLAMTYDAYRASKCSSGIRASIRAHRSDGILAGGQARCMRASSCFQRCTGRLGTRFRRLTCRSMPPRTRFIEDDAVSAHPIRLFHGAADNYVPVAPAALRRAPQRRKAPTSP